MGQEEVLTWAWIWCNWMGTFVLSEICANVSSELTWEHCLMIERVVERLHVPSCPNDQVSGHDMTNIIDVFWREFMHWQNMTGCYAVCRVWFSTCDALEGKSHIWHETYFLPYTKVLAFVACRVTLKRLGIGSRERAWSDVKKSKTVQGPILALIL